MLYHIETMRVVLPLVVVFVAILSSVTALLCRRCNGASTLADCASTEHCYQDEVCYMEEVITDALSIEYNGGCRALDVCKASAVAVGKRNEAVACVKCCDHGSECNTALCGIKSPAVSSSQCYSCRNGVSDPTQCTTFSSCQQDEMCGAETYTLAGHTTYRSTCMNKRICTLLTQEALKRKKECEDNPTLCPTVGRKSVPGTKICTACCGDGGCNYGSCEDLLDKLYLLWKNNVLDLNTLKTKPSSPTTG